MWKRLETKIIRWLSAPAQELAAPKLNELGEGVFYCKGKKNIRFLNYFDVQADLFIIDTRLRTLGFVVDLSETKATTSAIEEWVDRIAYVRHLMGRRSSSNVGLFNVELVFALTLAQRDAARSELNRVVREHMFLHALGIGLLEIENNDLTEQTLRRAFSWLLKDTRGWYAANTKSNAKNSADQHLSAIVLDNYRIEGKRTIELSSGKMTHLLHGHNGSGKSSLAEALEYALTGKIARLAHIPAEQYANHVVNKSHKQCEIQLLKQNKEKLLAFMLPQKPGSEVQGLFADQPRLPEAGCFRLDQVMMDDLVRKDVSQRAKQFLSSFFTSEQDKVATFLEKQFALQKSAAHPALARLINKEDFIGLANKIEMEWKWLTLKEMPENIELFLDVSVDDLEPCASLTRVFVNLKDAANFDDFLKYMGVFDEKANLLLQACTKRKCNQAIEIIRELESWTLGAQQSGQEAFDILLDKWTESLALQDLLQQELLKLEILGIARELKWNNSEQEKLLSQGVAHEVLEKHLTRVKTEKDENYRQLISSSETEFDQTASIKILNETEISLLNELGEWLKPEDSPKKLGTTIVEAIRKNHTVEFYRDFYIGQSGWCDVIKTRLQALNRVGDTLRKIKPIEYRSRLDALQAFYKAYQEECVAAKEIQDTFLSKVANNGPLNKALSELMALFTPTRWNYDELSVEHGSNEGKSVLSLKIGNRDAAELRLNTAELNLFTVTLFLLCAVNNDNPLKLLLLDDPLQNMDELTTITLARGWARLQYLWQDLPHLQDWQMLMLFHGEDDLSRFKQELDCAVYLLPTFGKQGETLIAAQHTTSTVEAFKLEEFISISKESTQTIQTN